MSTRAGRSISKVRRPRGRLWVCLAAATTAALAATPALAELTQRGNIFISFKGGISPKALPREAPAPIAVRIEGRIRTPAGQEPPALRRIEIALHRGGRLNTNGLPRCRRAQIASADSAKALAVCGKALVGSGGIVARNSFDDQVSSHVLRGGLLFFNARVKGRAAILAHLYQSHPVPTTSIIVFEIRRRGGTFGTEISAQIPPSVNRNGYLKSIFLQLQRRYVHRGKRRAYLSAACAAPPGFPGATFPFARASMTFEDGRTLSSTLVRSCRVRKGGS